MQSYEGWGWVRLFTKLRLDEITSNRSMNFFLTVTKSLDDIMNKKFYNFGHLSLLSPLLLYIYSLTYNLRLRKESYGPML